MADVSGKFYSATKVRTGVSPSSPGVEVGETLPPVNPPGSSLNSVGLTMPSAFAVANSPLTSNGTIAVTGAGTVAQYVRGDGTLADFPESSGGGSSVSYYLNGSVSQGTIGGVAYLEMNKVPILGAGTDFTIAANGYIASFITDAGDPNLLEIPGGNWNFESYFSASSGGGSPTFYVELYKVNAGGTATLIASSSAIPELIAFGTNITPYFSSLAVPTTVLALTDRLAVRYYVTHSGRTITLHTEGPHLCQIITTFTTGLTSLNGLSAQVQFFAVGTSGTDFNIASATATHTFNLPTASATNRGALSSSDWSTFNNKENAITAGTTAQYFRGDKTFQTLNTSVVPELTNLYYTEARVNANTNVAANTAARHNAVTLGTANGLSLSTQVLSLGLASAGVTGALSGTDWSTFNSKQNALTNPVTGTGTSGQVAYFTGTTTISSESNLFWDATNNRLGINNSVPEAALDLGNTGGQKFYNYNGGVANRNGSGLDLGGFAYEYSMFFAYGESDNGRMTFGSLNGTSYSIKMSIFGNGNVNIAGNLNIKSASTNAGLSPTVLATAEFMSTGSVAGYFWENRSGGVTSNSNWYGWYTSAGIVRLFNGSTDILEINGSTGAASFDSSVTATSIIRSGGTSSQYLMADGSVSTLSNPVTGTGSAGQVAYWSSGSAITGESNLFWDATNDRLGIGTASPATKLHITASNDRASVRLQNTAAAKVWELIPSLPNIANSGFSLYNVTDNTTPLHITDSGNLLVGTTTDAGFKLDVNGTGRFTSSVITEGNLYTITTNTPTYSILLNDIPVNDNTISLISFGARYNATTYGTGAQIRGTAAGTWSSTNYGSNLTFSTVTQNTDVNTERMRITSTGNVGIGTTDPTSLLNINSSQATTYDASVDDGQAGSGTTITLRNGSTTNNTFAQLNLQVSGDSGRAIARIVGIRTASATSDLAFVTESDNVKSEKMRITSGGNVGIGTASPTNILHAYSSLPRIISDTSSRYAVFNLYAAGSEKGAFYLDNTNKEIILEAGGDNTYPLKFNVAGSTRMFITTAGRVGIGFNTPSAKLSLGNDVGRKLFVYDDGGGANDIGGGMGTDLGGFAAETSIFFGNYAGAGRLSIGAWTSSQTYSTKLTVLANGNVLIGTTTNTGDILRVNGNTFTNTIMTWNPENDNRSGVPWRLGAKSDTIYTSNKSLRVNVGGVEYWILAREV